MGKDKELKIDAPGMAFSRMNYLYQAARLTAKITTRNPLSNHYNKVMKEISKKVLEKLHPDLKRTVCCACNYSLTAGSNQVNVKIKPYRKRKKRKSDQQSKKEFLKIKNVTSDPARKYYKHRIETRNKRPNKTLWTCNKCGYTKCLLQRPSKKLWIHEIEENCKLVCS